MGGPAPACGDQKDRIVPIGERAVAWCCKYLYEVRELLSVLAAETAEEEGE